MVTSVEDVIRCNHGNPRVLHKQSQSTAEQGLPHNIEPHTFQNGLNYGIWKLAHQSPFECHQLPANSHENKPSGSKAVSGGYTDRQVIS
jgi:hypothetical protein